jgi:CRISPR-associated protein Csd2
MSKEAIKNRYDFVYLFDVKDGNPNGDPDQGNLPRVDPENQEGLVTDVCIKRKVRNFTAIKHELKPPYDIFIRQGNVLNNVIEKAKGGTVSDRKADMCANYFDIRAFGAVMSTGEKEKNAGTVTGPVQFTFARSEDRVYQAEFAITRCAVATQKEADSQKDREFPSTIGRKSTVPYGLYRMHGFVSAADAQKTGFSGDDLELLWEALINAFEHDRSAARGEMNPRKLIVFKHASHLGNARSGQLFELVKVERKPGCDVPREFADYSVTIDGSKVPSGVELIEIL